MHVQNRAPLPQRAHEGRPTQTPHPAATAPASALEGASDMEPASAAEPAATAEPATAKGRNTRARIMGAAESLFAEHGYANVRVSDITAAAGLTTGAFYRYFSDRHELTIELLRALTAEVFEFIRIPLDATNLVVSVTESTQKYFEFYDHHRALFGVLVELSQTDTEVAEIWTTARRAFYDRISGAISRASLAEHIRTDINYKLAAEMLGSMTEFYAFQRFVLRDPDVSEEPLNEASYTLATIWLSGIARAPRAA